MSITWRTAADGAELRQSLILTVMQLSIRRTSQSHRNDSSASAEMPTVAKRRWRFC